jgi:hypothetical protein
MKVLKVIDAMTRLPSIRSARACLAAGALTLATAVAVGDPMDGSWRGAP